MGWVYGLDQFATLRVLPSSEPGTLNKKARKDWRPSGVLAHLHTQVVRNDCSKPISASPAMDG